MRPQRYTSPDGLITLRSESTRTIDAAHPEGYDDWIIALEPGSCGWHTHPDPDDPEGSSEAFIRPILEDRTVLALAYDDKGQLYSVRPLDPEWETVESELDFERDHAIPGWSTIYRLWSGKRIARFPEDGQL